MNKTIKKPMTITLKKTCLLFSFWFLCGPISAQAETESILWPQFQGSASHNGNNEAPAQRLPEIVWKAQVGLLGYLNNPIVSLGQILVPTSGNEWADFENEDYPPYYPLQYKAEVLQREGLRVLDYGTGKELKFLPTAANARTVAEHRGWWVYTSNAGEVKAFQPETGKGWQVPLMGIDPRKSRLRPLPETYGVTLAEDLAIVGDSAGRVRAYELETGRLRWQAQFQGEIRAYPTVVEQTIYLVSTTGEVQALDLQGKLRWKAEIALPFPPDSRRTDQYRAELFATPKIAGNLLLLPLLRRARYPGPALWALDRHTGHLVWQANDPQRLAPDYGNVRSSPALAGDLAIWAEPESNRIVALNWRTGKVAWVKAVGFAMPIQWASPVVRQNQVIVPRSDGGIYALNAQTGELQWQFYLGDPLQAGPKFPQAIQARGYQGVEEERNPFHPDSGDMILASPALGPNGDLLVACNGWLYRLGKK